MAATNHTEHEIHQALYALIAFGGSPTKASRALKEAFGLDISRGTLTDWRDSLHAQLYSDLREQHKQDIEDAIVRDTRDIARAATAAMRDAIEVVFQKIHDGNVRAAEAAQIAASMAKVQQTSVNEMLALTGRPQTITETRSAADIIRALAAKGVLELEPGS